MNIDRFMAHAICLALLLQATLAAAEPFRPWAQLTPLQHEALQPLAAQWDALPAKLQRNLLTASNHYPQLTLEQKKRFQSRLDAWCKLTPAQRERAREKFLAFNKIKPEIRAQVIQKAHEQAANSAASSVPISTLAH
jgi:Protein of unknown function (DUF3106)